MTKREIIKKWELRRAYITGIQHVLEEKRQADDVETCRQINVKLGMIEEFLNDLNEKQNESN